LYLFREDAPYNPLYTERLDRIGCYMCPSSDVAVIEVIRERYPDLWNQWEFQLSRWCEKQGLPSGWVDEMRWRMHEEPADETYSNC
jgi:phosphoadenosine phosphosulfate reductase